MIHKKAVLRQVRPGSCGVFCLPENYHHCVKSRVEHVAANISEGLVTARVPTIAFPEGQILITALIKHKLKQIYIHSCLHPLPFKLFLYGLRSEEMESLPETHQAKYCIAEYCASGQIRSIGILQTHLKFLAGRQTGSCSTYLNIELAFQYYD